MLGFIILVGTVVNNAILIVHQALNNVRYLGFAGVDAVLVDDVASTGHTLAEAASALKAAGARRIDVLVTHAVFADDALDTLRRGGIDTIWSSDSIPHPSNAFALSSLLAEAVDT